MPSETDLEGRSTRTENPLSALDEPVVVANNVANLDNIGVDGVLEDLDGLFRHAPFCISGLLDCRERARTESSHLRERHTSSEQLDQIARLEDDIRVERLPRSLDRHRTLDQIQRRANALQLSLLLDQLSFAPSPQRQRPKGLTCFSSADTTCPQISLK